MIIAIAIIIISTITIPIIITILINRGKLLHTRNHKSETQLENTTEMHWTLFGNNMLRKWQSFDKYL